METGEIEANLIHLNQSFQLPQLPELIERKLSGAEQSSLSEADVTFHQREYDRLSLRLQAASEQSRLPDNPSAKPALNDLLIRVRLNQLRLNKL
jgi:hypothetical protein